jgi:hypothetical protein
MSQTLPRQTSQVPAWLMFSGVVIGIVGAIVKKHAENIAELVGALGSRAATAAAAPAHWGMGLLIAGAAVVLTALIVIATRRPV